MGVKKTFCRAGLTIKKYSPEILTTVGVISFIGTVVYACKQTTKAHDILEAYKKEMDEIKEVKEISDAGNLLDPKGNNIIYEPEELRRDKFGAVSRCGVGLMKVYAGPVILGTVSITSFLSANHILKKRYLGAVAAFNIISNAFNKYRDRVRTTYGKEVDDMMMYGYTPEKREFVEVDENGKTKKHKEDVLVTDSSLNINPYAKFFDESCGDWSPDPELSRLFLESQERILTNKLHECGHLFLNEVYDALDIPRTGIGAVVGWIDGMGDNCIDFGLHRDDSNVRRFINGVENVVLLDFNVDGVIYDKLDMDTSGTNSLQDIYDYPHKWHKRRRKIA